MILTDVLSASIGTRKKTEIYTENGCSILAGLETRTPVGTYDWHGLRRGAEFKRPRLLFQYTLAGGGQFSVPGSLGTAVSIGTGSGFLAVLPSDHRYWLPADGGAWVFFYLIVEHPALRKPMQERCGELTQALTLSPDAPPVAKSIQICEAVWRNHFLDDFAVELAAFDWWLEWSRYLHSKNHPPEERLNLLNEIRAEVRDALPLAFNVEEAAARRGMSRSHFGHFFRKTTGLTPGAFQREIRLIEAARLLRETSETLEAIGRATGFADGTHFSKAFGHHFGMTPGIYRRHRSIPPA